MDINENRLGTKKEMNKIWRLIRNKIVLLIYPDCKKCYFCSNPLYNDPYGTVYAYWCKNCFNCKENTVQHWFDNKENYSIIIRYHYNKIKYIVELYLDKRNKTIITSSRISDDSNTSYKFYGKIISGLPITPQNIHQRLPLYLTMS